jgi:transcriptional regulator with XRE-family HTH domain
MPLPSQAGTDVPNGADVAWLRALGARLRQGRLAMRVTATAAAQAAGVSRPTWHRMEAGAPGVAAGSYARALDALGLAGLEAATDQTTDGGASSGGRTDAGARPAGTIPTRIRVGDWPELAALSWSLKPDTLLTPREALAVYERNGRHLAVAKLGEAEQALIEDLRTGLADDVHP